MSFPPAAYIEQSYGAPSDAELPLSDVTAAFLAAGDADADADAEDFAGGAPSVGLDPHPATTRQHIARPLRVRTHDVIIFNSMKAA
jgi:hypothetical protein